MNLKVNIAIALYNPNLSFFEIQLKSILDQTLRPNKIIFVDDNSSNFEEVKNIIRSYLCQSEIEYKILKNIKNHGVNFTFRKAYSYLDNGICFLSDQDDFWFRNKIEDVVNTYYKNNKPLLIINNCQFYRNNKIDQTISKLEVIKKITGSNKNFVAGCCTAVDKKIFEFVDYGIFKFLNYDDQLHMIADLLKSRIIIDQPLQLYRRHDNNVSNSEVNYPIKERLNFFGIVNKISFKFRYHTYYNYIRMNDQDFEDLIKSIKLSNNKTLNQFLKILNAIYYFKKNNSLLNFFKKNQFKNIDSILLLIGIIYVKAFKNEKK